MEKTVPSVYRHLFRPLGFLWLAMLCFTPRASFALVVLPPQLVVTSTNETCSGAGSISCVLNDPDGTSISFRVYLLPDTTSPIAVLNPSNNTLSATAGTYQIVASETVNGSIVNYPPQTVTITNDAVPLTYSVAHSDAHCGDGIITVTVTSGMAPFLYELLEGPETFPAQSSNVFSNLTGGIYKVRVTDGCGVQIPLTHIVPVQPVSLDIGGVNFPQAELPDCNSITISNAITPTDSAYNLIYPMTCTYTVFPPGGGPSVTVTTTIGSGGASNVTAVAVIPFWHDQTYSYNLVITDGCGQNWVRNNISINQKLLVILETTLAECGGYTLTVRPKNFVSPYSIAFNQAPVGFDPIAFNAQHPGPFFGETQIYGDDNLPVPFGNYTVTLTDACGRSATKSQEIEDLPIEAISTLYPHPGCQSNMSDLEGYWPGQVLESVTLVQAPEAYPNTLPEDLTGTIADISTFYHNNLIAGDYLYILENSCGVSYELEVTINPSSTNLQMITSTRADCELGKGGIRISGNQSSIVSITMTGAPPEFEQQLPLDVSNYLTVTGVFSITNLPPGLYSFDILDSCGVQHLLTDKAVVAYVVDESEITITKHCNSFEASINHASQNTVSQSFWLQRYNEIDMVWEHPLTGADHTEGNAPTLVTAVPLSNFQNNINLDYLGSFRIIKSFTAFDNGFVGPNPYKTCIEVLETFEHDGNVHIVDVVKLTCDGALSSVKVIADGVAPFTYSITEKNGEPFLVDNGTNDTFTNLEPAIYKFVVGQFCGGTDPYVVDISSLPSLVDAFPPQPQLFSCENPADDGAGTFDLSVQNSFILGTQDAALYNISYHQSQADADAGLNPLPSLHTTVPATIYGRIEVTGGTCYRTVSFDLVVQPLPELGFSTQVGLCPGEGKTLTATPGYDSYLWSTGETGNAVFVDEPGELTLTVTRNYPSGPCSATFVINVQPQPVAEINEIVTSDWTDRANTITVLLNNPENSGFEFSIDGINWQQSNTFDGLSPGAYTVQVRDTAGCGETSATVNLLMYPLFFTPNGDGYNDSWKIKLAELEPGLQTFIYDRYGKFLKQLGYNSQGWDGTHAGKMLPSTDYWFLVKRADGREFRGHFTMKR